jgi:hypothetical protein
MIQMIRTQTLAILAILWFHVVNWFGQMLNGVRVADDAQRMNETSFLIHSFIHGNNLNTMFEALCL